MLVSRASAESAQLDRDDRVRVKALSLGSEPLAGRVSSIDGTLLTLIPESSAQSTQIPLNEITSFEISRGRPSRLWWGALTGAIIFGTVGARAAREETRGGDHPLDEMAPVIGAAVLALPGALIGGVIGAFVHGEERWESVGVRSVRLGVSPAQPGLFVSLSF